MRKFVFCDVTLCRLVYSTTKFGTILRPLDPKDDNTILRNVAKVYHSTFFLRSSFDINSSKFLPTNQSYSCFHFLRSSKTSSQPVYLEALGNKGSCIEKKEGPNIWLAELILRNDKAHSYTTLSFVKAVFGVQRGRHIEDCMTQIHLYCNVMHCLWGGWEEQVTF